MRRIFGPKRDEVTESGENYVMKSLMICIAHQYCSGNQIEMIEMGGACSAFGEEQRCMHCFAGET
jgi:hypothetical protein